jgi:hypothetical protein
MLVCLSIFYEYQQFFQHRICFSIQPQLQLVNLHRNRRYFVIKLHTWFCLSYFLKTNIKLYCIYQYFMSINSFVNTVSVSRYSRPITVTQISSFQPQVLGDRIPPFFVKKKFPVFFFLFGIFVINLCYIIILCKFTSWSGETPTGNFRDVFWSWTRIMSVLIQSKSIKVLFKVDTFYNSTT